MSYLNSILVKILELQKKVAQKLNGIGVYQLPSQTTLAGNQFNGVQQLVKTDQNGLIKNQLIDINYILNKVEIGDTCAFYKCASVDTTAKTWSGYKAVLGEDSAYSFEETVTEGLTYGVWFTPAVDGIFNSDCTVKVSELYLGPIIPEEGMQFYAPFTKESSTASTGQEISTVGNPQYTTVQGIKCMQLDGSSCVNTTLLWNLDHDFDFAVSVMAYLGDSNGVLFSCGQFIKLTALIEQGVWEIAIASGPGVQTTATASGCNANQWYHVVFIRSNGTVKLYINGNEVASMDNNYAMYWVTFYWGCLDGGTLYLNGALAAARIYTRALTEIEITSLSKEFTPTAF